MAELSISDLFQRPPSGFHFAVFFELFPITHNDFRFQEVSGLTVTVETEEFAEGGENRFKHKLPKRTSYGQLELKRGLFVGSGIVKWAIDAIENFQFAPTNVTVALLNEFHVPLQAWYVVNAYPIEWSVSGFNAQSSEVVIESIKLNYNYYNVISVESLIGLL